MSDTGFFQNYVLLGSLYTVQAIVQLGASGSTR